MKTKIPVFIFGWPSNVGGADTKLAHLIRLLAGEYDLTVVPNSRERFAQGNWVEFLKRFGARAAMLDDLPRRLKGWGLSLCNGAFFSDGIAAQAKARGLRLAWSSEMMWHHASEQGAIMGGMLDKVLYVSAKQRAALEPGYAVAAGNLAAGSARSVLPTSCRQAQHPKLPARCRQHAGGESFRRCVLGCVDGDKGTSGVLPGGMKWHLVGNYIDAAAFPFRERWRAPRRFEEFVIGRLSRPDPAKFPVDFPESYQRLRLKHPRYRVMAWSEQLAGVFSAGEGAGEKGSAGVGEKAAGHAGAISPSLPHSPTPSRGRFRGTWDLLPAEAEPTVEFLHSLDLFVYDLREDCSESWGRAVVEVMLTGAVPLVPSHPRHHLKHLIPQGVGGFLCSTNTEWREHAQRLQRDEALRKRMSQAAREFAERELCNAAKHRAAWRRVFED